VTGQDLCLTTTEPSGVGRGSPAEYNRAVTRRAELTWLTSIVIFGVALRVAAIVALDDPFSGDGADYFAMGVGVVAGTGVADTNGLRAFFNAGYPLFVVAPALWIGAGIAGVQALNVGLGVVTILLCRSLALGLQTGTAGGLLAAALFAAYLPASVYAEYIAKENLMTPLLVAAAVETVAIRRRGALGIATRLGAIYGGIALVGNAALAVLPVTLAVVAGLTSSLTHRVRSAGVILAIAFAVTTPWLVRNAVLLGRPVLNTNGGFNLYIGNNPAATGGHVPIQFTPAGREWSALLRRGEVAASDELGRQAVAWIAHNPFDALWLAVRKVAGFWSLPVHDGLAAPTPGESLARAIWALQYGSLVLAAVACMAWVPTRTAEAQLVAAMIVAFTALHAAFYVMPRYREPVMPLVCVLAAAVTSERWISPRSAGTPGPR
jgi:hypothetical protein